MRCDEFRRWLDEGMPPHARVAAEAHAGACASCRREHAAAEAMERALRVAPPSPAGADQFVARVLERIEAAPAAETIPAAPAMPAPARRRPPLWWSLWSEPAFMAGAATLLAILLLPPGLRGDAWSGAAVAATVAAQALGTAFTNGMAAATGALALALPPDLHPAARLTFFLGFGVPLLWAGLWFVGAVDRWLRQGLDRRS